MKVLILTAFIMTTVLSCQTTDSSMVTPTPATTPPASASSPSVDTNEKTKQALIEAIADERRAKATYKAVIEKFGNMRPFSNIVGAEARHESFLLELFAKYRLEVPADEFANKQIELPPTMQEVCKQAVEGEKANIAMYDRLLTTVNEADVKQTFVNLRNASNDNHLPAFERCSRGGGRGPGFRGNGPAGEGPSMP